MPGIEGGAGSAAGGAWYATQREIERTTSAVQRRVFIMRSLLQTLIFYLKSVF
jgi:hypothetical protein